MDLGLFLNMSHSEITSSSLLQIHQARWTSAKVAYLCCRYYPLLVYPLYMWAWLGNHPAKLCIESAHPLYSFLVPFVSLVSGRLYHVA
jgi:hypothetical protein